MPNVLTTSSTVTCLHQGTATTPSSAKLSVSGNPVLLADGVSSWVIKLCSQVGTGLTPCTSVLSIQAGQAAKLSVGGVAVLLDSLAGTTNGSPGNSLSAAANQSKLTAV